MPDHVILDRVEDNGLGRPRRGAPSSDHVCLIESNCALKGLGVKHLFQEQPIAGVSQAPEAKIADAVSLSPGNAYALFSCSEQGV